MSGFFQGATNLTLYLNDNENDNENDNGNGNGNEGGLGRILDLFLQHCLTMKVDTTAIWVKKIIKLNFRKLRFAQSR